MSNDTQTSDITERAQRIIAEGIGNCQSALVDMLFQRGDIEGFQVEDIENLNADPSDWDEGKCLAWLEENGVSIEEREDPSDWLDTLRDSLADIDTASVRWDKHECIQSLTQAGLDIPDKDYSWEEDEEYLEYLRTEVRDNDNGQEVLEWWPVDNWLCQKLKEIQEPVLDNDYGQWWGRTCSGQAIYLDGTIQKIVERIDR